MKSARLSLFVTAIEIKAILGDFIRIELHSNELEVWDDTKISPGDVWREEPSRAISRSRIALLLIRADFLASDFITQDELPQLLEAALMKETKIVPVLLSPCCVEDTFLAQFQFMNYKPLSGMNRHGKETLWVEVVARVKEIMGS